VEISKLAIGEVLSRRPAGVDAVHGEVVMVDADAMRAGVPEVEKGAVDVVDIPGDEGDGGVYGGDGGAGEDLGVPMVKGLSVVEGPEGFVDGGEGVKPGIAGLVGADGDADTGAGEGEGVGGRGGGG